MIAYASAFPDSVEVHPSTIEPRFDDRCWIIRTDDGVSIHLTNQQAAELAFSLTRLIRAKARKAA